MGSILARYCSYYIFNDVSNVFDKLKFIWFADDTNVFSLDKILKCV